MCEMKQNLSACVYFEVCFKVLLLQSLLSLWHAFLKEFILWSVLPLKCTPKCVYFQLYFKEEQVSHLSGCNNEWDLSVHTQIDHFAAQASFQPLSKPYKLPKLCMQTIQKPNTQKSKNL